MVDDVDDDEVGGEDTEYARFLRIKFVFTLSFDTRGAGFIRPFGVLSLAPHFALV